MHAPIKCVCICVLNSIEKIYYIMHIIAASLNPLLNTVAPNVTLCRAQNSYRKQNSTDIPNEFMDFVPQQQQQLSPGQRNVPPFSPQPNQGKILYKAFEKNHKNCMG